MILVLLISFDAKDGVEPATVPATILVPPSVPPTLLLLLAISLPK